MSNIEECLNDTGKYLLGLFAFIICFNLEFIPPITAEEMYKKYLIAQATKDIK